MTSENPTALTGKHLEMPGEQSPDRLIRAGRHMGALLPDLLGLEEGLADAEPEVASYPDKTRENQDSARRTEIENDLLLDALPLQDRAEVISQTYELYKAAKETVAPVITAFADGLLQEAGERQIVFAGRDGLGAYRTAGILREKFDYANQDPQQLVYAYLTRAVVRNTPRATLEEYLRQAGIRDTDDSVVLADIGMYGSILYGIRSVLPRVEPRYLISKTPEVPGYADGQHARMAALSSVPGNSAVHFLEDTFSGPYPSPKNLVERSGRLVPDIAEGGFPPAEMLKREYAMRALEDYAKSLDARPAQPASEAIGKLDAFLGDTDAYKHLMVPHTR